MNVRPSMVIVKDKKILVMKYNYNGNTVYGLPGGNPDRDETLEQTLIRELKEELNLEVAVGPLILTGEVIFAEKNKSTLHCVFLGASFSGSPALNPDHTTALTAEWKEVAEIDSLNLYPNVGQHIKSLLNENKPDTNIYIGRIDQKWF